MKDKMRKFWIGGLHVLCLCVSLSVAYRPLLVWHGFNDSCEGPIQRKFCCHRQPRENGGICLTELESFSNEKSKQTNKQTNPSLPDIISHVRSTLPGIYVFCIRIGNSSSSEKRASVFMPLKQQLDIACAQVAKIPELRKGFNALGESQGGILMRALVQK